MNLSVHFQLHLEQLRPPYKSSTKGVTARASEAGQCDRRLYYRLRDSYETGASEEPPSANSTIAFHIGNNIHDEFQAMMLSLYPKSFTGEVKWVYPNMDNPIVSGRCDGTYLRPDGKKVAIEIKTCGKWSYSKAMENDQPHAEHALQAAMSCTMLQADLVQIIYISKEYIAEYEPIHVWTYPISESIVVNEVQRMARLLKLAYHKASTPPRLIRGDAILDPERDSRCNFCPYLDRCSIDGPEPPPSRRKPSTRRG